MVGRLRLCSDEPLWLYARAWRAVWGHEKGKGIAPSGGLEVEGKYDRESALRKAARGT